MINIIINKIKRYAIIYNYIYKMFKLVICGMICAMSVMAQQAPKWGIEKGVMGSMGMAVTFTSATRGFYPMT